MPDSKKTTWAQLRVGVMAIFALSILAVLIVLMSGSRGLFPRSSEVYTYFGDSAAIIEGAPVRLNGILVGKVGGSELSGSSDPDRIVKVTLNIDDKFMGSIPVDSTAGLAQTNLLGTRFVNIKKGTSPQTIQPGAELTSATSAALEDLFQQGTTTLGAAEILVKRLDGIVASIETGKGTIGAFLTDRTLYNRLVEITDDIRQLTTQLNSPDSTMGRLINEDTLYQDFRGVATRITTLLDGLDAGQGTAGKFLKDDAMYEELRGAIADVRDMIGRINRGDGTVSKLLNSSEMHDRIIATFDRLDAVLDKVNSGDGTVGRLLNDPALYESLDGTTRELQGLLKDIRSDPRKFLTIRLRLF